MHKASFILRSRNPDVLTCIANLSSDEVFTPPELANQMLDTLAEAWAERNSGANIWEDKTVKFLDPFTKSGIFLREITLRLIKGLENEFPNLNERLNHIFSKQVYGIAITYLTSLLARRSLYCSKQANGKYSIAKCFNNEAGNIWFERINHTWKTTKCQFCEAPKAVLDRDDELENYAYAFIHTDNIKTRIIEIFGDNMQFDVIIGNPPYQMKGGAGGTSDSSIYHLFVEQAQRLEPRFVSMVIPSRWLAGGRGLNEFRKSMLTSGKLVKMADYPVSKEVFSNVEVKGGICYFLWSHAHKGLCEYTLTRGTESVTTDRKLDEFDVFVRDSRSASILRKVLKLNEDPITNILTADTPFGIATNFKGFKEKPEPDHIALHYVKSGKRLIGYVPRADIRKNTHLIDKWKILVPKAGSDGGQKIPDSVLGKPWLCSPNSVATQTFLAFYLDTENEARSVESYYCSKFFRHLVSLRKFTQDALKPMYSWVPMQSWDCLWTDDMLYKKYKLTKDEINYIETVVKPMESATGIDDE